MTDLTAIDILVNPDEATIQHAREWNERMRTSVPGGFALDATHEPHITTLQRYVRTSELDQVYAAVEQTLDDLKSIETEPFDAFDVHPASVAVYHLGDNGAARKRLKAWPVAG